MSRFGGAMRALCGDCKDQALAADPDLMVLGPLSGKAACNGGCQ
jgi:hypothetical protein